MTDGIIRSVTRGSFTSHAVYQVQPFVGLLDTYPDAVSAHSFRLLRGDYAGAAVRIRRSGDDTEQDIGFNGPDFDAAAAASFITAGGGTEIGYIAAWYDQSENGLDMTQTTAAAQPVYGAAVINSALPAGQYDGSDDEVNRGGLDFSTYVTNRATLFAVIQADGTATDGQICCWRPGGTDCIELHTEGTLIYFHFGAQDSSGSVNGTKPVGWAGTDHIIECWRDGSDSQNINADGANIASASRTASLISSIQAWRFGTENAGRPFKGYLSEVVLWPVDQGSTNRTAIRTDLNSYYSVF